MFEVDLDQLKEEAEEIKNNLDLIKEKIAKDNNIDTKELFNKLDNECKYINDMVSMIIKNREDEDKLNKALMFFIEEYEGRVDNIENILHDYLD